ncbi:Hypothetical_protein [Hexamita inflata]|uniref:Hypothetical_protein n=1 Tax=Hexamita inflata TaxID=28002 RepID=A0AA86NTM1_9EUKA|nr:Hypothetical protein HINF_LOCUS13483 [Hexamita inflata]
MRFVVSLMLSCYTPQASCIDYNVCGTQKITDVTVSCNNAQTCKNLMFNGFEVSMCPFYAQQSDCNNNCGHTCELTYQNVNYSYSTGASKINNSMNGNVWTCGKAPIPPPNPDPDQGTSICTTNLSGGVITVYCPVKSTCTQVYRQDYGVYVNVCSIYERYDKSQCDNECHSECLYAGDVDISFKVAIPHQQTIYESEQYLQAYYCRAIDVASNQSKLLVIIACGVAGAIILGVIIFVIAWFTCCKNKKQFKKAARSESMANQGQKLLGVTLE